MAKKGVCLDCGNNRSLVAGRCQFCYWNYRKKISQEKSSLKKQEENPDLETWFLKRISEMKGKCSECGLPISMDSERFFLKCSVAHLLPKSLFPSVADHVLNWIELGSLCGCHHRYDSNWKNACKMKIWKKVIAKIRVIYPSISGDEKRRLPDIILQEMSNRGVEKGEKSNPMGGL